MTNRIVKHLLGAALLAFSSFAAAEDIDLFIGRAPSDAANAPNVLLVMDNSANFSSALPHGDSTVCRISSSGNVYTSTATVAADNIAANNTALNGKNGGVEQCALYSVIKGIDTSAGVKVHIGVMMFNSNGQLAVDPSTGKLAANCIGNDGGCLVYPIVPLTAANQTALLTWIKNWSITSGGSAGDTVSSSKQHVIKGSASGKNGGAMQESWAYFKGKMGLSGRDYSSVKPDSPCGNNFVIFIGNAYSNNSHPGDATGDAGPKNALFGTNSVSGKNADPAASTSEKTLYTDTITTSCGTDTLTSDEGRGAYALNWAYYMRNQNITTYSIGVLGSTCASDYAAHLTKMGQKEVGGGKYFPTYDYAGLKTAMDTILGEIQSVNTVFASVSLPVSVNTQGTYLNQVYIGMFRPDADAYPRWAGNLKQYKLGLVGDILKLQDADGSVDTGGGAINTSTGFITECARSYWTPNAIDTYWSFGTDDQKGNCTAVTGAKDSNYPDGNIVEKGGHAYKLRSTTTRTVKTCSPVFNTCATTSALTDFATTNTDITQALLDSTSATDKATLINWARGLNLQNEGTKGTTVMRPSSHGDVVHSRPVALNYATTTDISPKVVVYYGSNDGMLHAINGNRDSLTDTTSGSITSGSNTYAAGTELWSFMPPEFYVNINRLYGNSTTISYKTSTISGALPKPYGFDGPITAYKTDSLAWIYAAMRRGGRAIYAFDVSTPGIPTLKWKKGCPNNFPTSGTVSDTNCSNDASSGNFTGLGQTWSSAKTMLASGYDSGASPVLIMGGGYDTCEDFDDGTANHNCTTAGTKGNHIYVLKAADGSILKKFDTARSVAGDVTVVKDSTTGIAKYAYATDLGGNVYRISGATANAAFETTAPADWTITRIASLGCGTPSSSITAALPCNANRKFMFAPDVVSDNGLYVLLIGSGDREKPLSNYAATYAVTNYFFMIKDNPLSDTWLSSESSTCDGTSVICKSSLFGITSTANPTQTQIDEKKGWYLQLNTHEQVVTTSVTVFGTVSFSTHQPATNDTASSCSSNLGTSLVYNIAYSNAASSNGTSQRYQDLGGDGLPPSPVAGQVTLDNGQTIPFCIGCSADSPLEGKYEKKPASGAASQYKTRVYWYIQK